MTTTMRWSGLPWMTVCALGLAVHLAVGATWQGGTNEWASDNWGLNSPDGYPGDASHPTETAMLNVSSGEALIKSGDYLTNNATVFATKAAVRQTGGVWMNNNNIDIRTRFDLLGGTVAGNGYCKIGVGATWMIDGGELGTRVTTHDGIPTGGGLADKILTFEGLGGACYVTEAGIVDLHTIKMSDMTAGGVALLEVRGVVVSGNRYDRSTLYCHLYKSATATSATARFIFSEEGISPWTLISNNSLYLGVGANRGLLEADVSACVSDGATGFILFNYTAAIQGDGTFGSVTINDATLGTLTPGTPGNLQPGEYFLNYADSATGDGTAIVLYYNNAIPLGTVVVIR